MVNSMQKLNDSAFPCIPTKHKKQIIDKTHGFANFHFSKLHYHNKRILSQPNDPKPWNSLEQT